MIWVNYTRLERILPPDVVRRFLNRLPQGKADAIARLQNHEQSTASALGLILLGQAMQQLNVADFSFDQLKYSPGEKPVCSQGIEFSITHSESIVACAVSENTIVGIDNETIDVRPAALLRHVFNETELAVIKCDNEKFLELWVKKEAVAKASGAGVRAMKSILLDDEQARYNDQLWYLHRLALDENDVSYLACQQPQPDIHIQYHAFDDCMAYCNAASLAEQRYG